MSITTTEKRAGVDMNDLILDRVDLMRKVLHLITGNWIAKDKYLRRDKLLKYGLATDEQYTRAVNALYDRHYLELILKADPMKSAIEGIQALIDEGWLMHVISAVDEDAFELLREWRRKQGLAREEIQFSGVGRYGNKNQFGEFLVYVDNDVAQLDVMASSARFLILFDRYGERRSKIHRRVGDLKISLFRRRIQQTFRTIIVVSSWKKLVKVMKLIGKEPHLAQGLFTLPEKNHD